MRLVRGAPRMPGTRSAPAQVMLHTSPRSPKRSTAWLLSLRSYSRPARHAEIDVCQLVARLSRGGCKDLKRERGFDAPVATPEAFEMLFDPSPGLLEGLIRYS